MVYTTYNCPTWFDKPHSIGLVCMVCAFQVQTIFIFDEESDSEAHSPQA